jgi:hypothetical protein
MGTPCKKVKLMSSRCADMTDNEEHHDAKLERFDGLKQFGKIHMMNIGKICAFSETYQETIEDKDDLIDTMNTQICCLHKIIDEKDNQIKELRDRAENQAVVIIHLRQQGQVYCQEIFTKDQYIDELRKAKYPEHATPIPGSASPQLVHNRGQAPRLSHNTETYKDFGSSDTTSQSKTTPPQKAASCMYKCSLSDTGATSPPKTQSQTSSKCKTRTIILKRKPTATPLLSSMNGGPCVKGCTAKSSAPLLPPLSQAKVMDVPSALRLLSLNPPFDHDDLKQAYRRMALQYHPDKNKSDNAKMEFQALTEARCLLEWYTLPI